MALQLVVVPNGVLPGGAPDQRNLAGEKPGPLSPQLVVPLKGGNVAEPAANGVDPVRDLVRLVKVDHLDGRRLQLDGLGPHGLHDVKGGLVHHGLVPFHLPVSAPLEVCVVLF